MRKIGVLGGSFNPPHNDHIRIAEYIKENLKLDDFIIVPNAQPPHKDTCHVDFAHRRRMLELLIKNCSNISISDIENDPSVPHFTTDLIDKLNNLYKDCAIFFCMGMDSLIYLDEWRDGLKLSDKCNLVVIGRKGYRLEDSHPLVINYLNEHAVLEGQMDFNERLNSKKGNCFLLKACFNDVSSSKIRAELNDFYQNHPNGSDLAMSLHEFPYTKNYLNLETIDYITKNSLYKMRES